MRRRKFWFSSLTSSLSSALFRPRSSAIFRRLKVRKEIISKDPHTCDWDHDRTRGRESDFLLTMMQCVCDCFQTKKKTACALCSKNGANWKCKMPCSWYLKKLIWSVPHNTCFPLDLDLNHKRAWEMFEIWSAVVHWCILQSQGFFVYLFIYCCMI